MGSEDYLDDLNDPRVNAENDARVVAKALQSKKPKHFGDTTVHYRFYVKINPNFELFNPIEYHSSITDKKLFSHINSVCKQSWEFKEVDRSIFDKYILFLKTKSIQTLRDIERHIK
jgi:hypothetical protein